jgi:hypothetical protein
MHAVEAVDAGCLLLDGCMGMRRSEVAMMHTFKDIKWAPKV